MLEIKVHQGDRSKKMGVIYLIGKGQCIKRSLPSSRRLREGVAFFVDPKECD